MPGLAFKACARNGCGKLTQAKFCDSHAVSPKEERKRFDQGRAADPIRRLYFTRAWQFVRRIALLRDPVCKICNKEFSKIADHVVQARKWVAQHGGDLESFYDESNLQGVCESCHNSKTAKECGWAGNRSG